MCCGWLHFNSAAFWMWHQFDVNGEGSLDGTISFWNGETDKRQRRVPYQPNGLGMNCKTNPTIVPFRIGDTSTRAMRSGAP
jgi:hypothetical protein